MKRSILHIFLSLFLTFAVTDYIWIHLLQDDEVVAELEIEKEKEGEEEKLREGETSKEENKDYSCYISLRKPFSELNMSTGFLKIGNTFTPLSQRSKPGFHILYRQLKLDC